MIQFHLPDELIAQEPVHPRDHARLLVYDRKTKQIHDMHFYDLPAFLPVDSTLVVNNSKVEHCRWLFDDGKTEIFVLNKLDTHMIQAMVRPGKKFKVGANIELMNDVNAEVVSIDLNGFRTLRLNISHDDERLKKYEHVPLPPYIQQNDELADEYQTVYADPLGSKAAPTAGLHFTDELLRKINVNHKLAEITLHVGLGTFASLTDEQIASGKLHAEHYEISEDVYRHIESAGHITAVGTTTCRTLETVSSNSKLFGETDIFIQPGYKFKRVDSLITNFHLPGTSLLLLVEAFVGDKAELQRIYSRAIEQKYRFYSFGDAMLIR